MTGEPAEPEASDVVQVEDVAAEPEASEPDDAEETDADEEQGPTFADLGLDDKILKALRDLGYERPSPIQAETIPALLAGHDVVGLAQTGTGKTAAFALPILERLTPRAKHVQALVLAPTRELALQVAEAFETYAAHLKVRLLPVYGGQGYGVQLSALARGVDVVVGTPGRVMDHLDRGTLDLTQLEYLVLDEADEMLNMGFAEDVEKILADTPADKQVALFSATMPPSIRKLAATYLTDPVEISVKGKTATATNVTHRYTIVSYPQKLDALTRILEVENFDGMIVFVRTKNETETVAEKLRARGISAAAINGDLPQAARERTINQLKAAKLDVLVATDVAARGLDVDRISHVVNFDIPTDTESYVHRIGRTGRAGRSGDAISFVTPRERHLLRAIERATGQELSHMPLPTADDINATRLSRFDDAITAALGQQEKIDFFRDVVAHYVNEYDVPEVDVAAALAAVMQGDEPMLLDPEQERRDERFREDKAGRGTRDRDRGTDGPRDGTVHERRPRPTGDLVPWRVAVGRRHRITPRQIVGALANEGGLTSADMGRINIRGDHSIIELPPDLPSSVLDKLSRTRVSGKLIELQRDEGPSFVRDRTRERDRDDRDDRDDRGDRGDRGDRSWGDRPARDRGDRPFRDKPFKKSGFNADKKFKKPRHKG
ncbi:DEAD/DEAH box helicase [Propioniciclava sp. MC1595]|nr:DEAD/DEAH box helicase [Propioniciclava sp. MC1595]